MVLWMGANKIKSTGSPTIFCFPRLHSTCFAHRFSYSSRYTWEPFHRLCYMEIGQRKGNSGISSHYHLMPPPPPRPQIISARYITVEYITVEPQSSKQSRFLIIENYMNIDVVFLVATSIISKDDYPQQQQKCTVICGIANSSVSAFQVKALVQYRSPFQRQFIKQNKIVTSHLASGNASLFMKKIKVTRSLVPIIRGQIIEVQLNYFMNSFAV